MDDEGEMPSSSSSFESLCGNDPFWNRNQSWDTPHPEFSTCFRKTALIWGPCALFWAMLPFHIYIIYKSKNPTLQFTKLCLVKTIAAIALFGLALIDASFWAFRSEMNPVDVLDPTVRLVTFGAILAVVQVERRKGLRISGVQFLFWTFYLIAQCFDLYSFVYQYLKDDGNLHPLPFVTFLLTMLFVIVSYCCHFFAEPRALYEGPVDGSQAPLSQDDKPCPELDASFPSHLTFGWFTGFAWTGIKRSLTEDDLWSLTPSITSEYIVPKFQTNWQAAVKKAAQFNELHGLAPKAEKHEGNGDVSFNLADESITVKTKPDSGKPKEPKLARVFPAMIRTFGVRFVLASLQKLIHDTLIFVAPMLLKLIIAFAASDDYIWKGIIYAFLLLITSMLQTIFLSRYFYDMYIIGIWIKSALTSAIYRKSLTISSAGKKESTTGEVVNLMSVDTQRVVDMMPYINMIWSAPFQIAISLFLLYRTLGASVFAGFFVMILLIPLNGVIAGMSGKLQQKQMKEKDQRVKMMNEILQGIKILKLYAWEPSFQALVGDIRKKEVQILKQMGYLAAGTSFIWSCAPFVVSLVTFATYVLSDPANVLDSEKAFVSLSLFNILRFPLSMLPMMIMNAVQASVALKRIDKFMNSEELTTSVEVIKDTNGHSDGHVETVKPAIEIENGDFQWESDQEKLTLEDINVTVNSGSLVAVVGTVGAGKSSLMSAILGELEQKSGHVRVKGSIAYTSQQAWIQNATVKNNILFHLPYDEKKYDQVLEACALKADLDILPGGDNTEIGEKGINLSGGQKQRVSLARAVYGNADVFLLDDPLSAVDSHVGKHIFTKVIGPDGLLAGKTRVLVTHSITYLPQVDNIIVIKEGQISEVGTYKELLAQKGAFAEFLVQYFSQEIDVKTADLATELEILRSELEDTMGGKDQLGQRLAYQRAESEQKEHSRSASPIVNGSKKDLSRSMSQESGSPRKSVVTSRQGSVKPKDEKDTKVEEIMKAAERQYESEKTETGGVKWTVYLYYIVNMGLVLFGSCAFFFTISQIFSAWSSIWLSIWSDQADFKNKTMLPENNSTNGNGNETEFENLNINPERDMYLGVYGGLGFGQAFCVVFGSMFLYLATLKGARTLHDNMLSNVLRSPMAFFDTTPQGRILNRFGKDVDVLDATMPMILRGWITCLLGVASSFIIIAYTTPVFLLPVALILGFYYLVQRIYVACSRQLKRLESVSRSPIYSHFGETVTGAATIRAYNLQSKFIRQSELIVDENQKAYFPSVVANRWLSVRLETVGNMIIFCATLLAVLGRDTLSPGLVGLSVSYALSVTQTLNWLVRMASEVETNIVAVERLKEYSDTPKEAEWTLEETKPKENWPDEGRIEFKGYSSRYREGLDLVLKQISFVIEGGQKVGIVGRTGAGKSSLTLALFRLVEPAEGTIVIDGVDISKLGLHELRNQLTIIPQDPVLFSGSLRMNLDPFNKYTDDQLWTSLKLSHLDNFVNSLTAGLEHLIAEGGENLSVGQRQLICLARALLRKTKILVLDEATAAVDLETDELIQNTIKKEFSDCTVITIAHRLNTIMDYDKILVLAQGERVEYDAPKNLLNNKNSLFYSMCRDAALVS